MGTVEIIPPEEFPHERMYQAAIALDEWQSTAIARVGASGELSFRKNSLEPDHLLRTILDCAREMREERLELQKRVK